MYVFMKEYGKLSLNYSCYPFLSGPLHVWTFFVIILQIEQLSDQTGEESIIMTASINDGTLSHLGSNMGKGFFEGHEEIKSQFLGYCLKSKC